MDPTAPGATALKEWGAVGRALLAGRQCLLLRGGGVHERRFTVGAPRFLLFPTVAHSHAEAVRPEHRDLLAGGAEDSTDERVVVRCALEVVEALPVARPEGLSALSPLHVWTQESVRGRLDFRPRHRLTAVVVRARALPEPQVVPRRPEHRGCSSWVELDLGPELAAAPSTAPALDDDRLLAAVDAVRAAVG
ncbi:DUF1802 family protein [uncultured Pseudokineococcus sp.]|uniref:DUF1802 family protein n=1 Tax=uncultured Pseudokineococcus sp. TaxID=1642928 RepID=UPI0026349FFF|nr:DUF1802 family protein [uncultured Pseudokineococcus sp.]